MCKAYFFRQNTCEQAIKNSVNGWVRNLADGRVEAVFEGEKENVEKMVEFCRKGSVGAKVEKVEVKWEEFKNEFEDFEIKY